MKTAAFINTVALVICALAVIVGLVNDAGLLVAFGTLGLAFAAIALFFIDQVTRSTRG